MIDISLLKKINILQEVEDKHLEKISKICKLIHYNTPTVLFEYGSKTNSIFMILDGSVDHLLPSKDNKLIKIYQSRTGETIGLSALLPREYVALFTASTNEGLTGLIEVDVIKLKELFEKDTSLSYIFIKQVLKAYNKKKSIQNITLISFLTNHPELKKYIA